MQIEPLMFWGLLAAFLATVVAVYLLEHPARAFGLLDHPCRRKRHLGTVPLTGGLAVAFGWACGGMLVVLPFSPFWSLGAGVVVLLALDVLDDRFSLRAYPRLFVHLGVASLVVAAGVQVSWFGNLFGYGSIGLNVFAVPFTVLAIAFLINAVNMMDGMDGLSGGVVFIAILALAALAFSVDMDALGQMVLLLAAALAGFLLFNLRFPWRNRALVFLGDSGSMLLGFSLAWFAVALGGTPETGVAPVTVALLLLIPVADSLAVMIRRSLHGRSPLSSDRTHLHHILLRAGISVRRVWSIIMLNQLLLALFALGSHQYGVPQHLQALLAGLVLAGYVAFSLRGARFLRYMGWRRRRVSALARARACAG